MNILKTIGSVFVKIWRWIKNTAWVQPLLIVGTIFGVIFAIPSITGWIQGLVANANSADKFYSTFKKSMEGDASSAADSLLYNYEKYEEGSKVPGNEEKYFLFFTSSNNSASKELKEGFEQLRNHWGSLYSPADGTAFRIYTIFTDEKTTSTTPEESAFSQYLLRHANFFETASDVGINKSAYILNKKVTEEELSVLADADPSTFKVPTLMLIDWKNDLTVYPEGENQEPGIKQIMFDVPGSSSYEKATTLYNCWNNKGDFSFKEGD